MQVSIRMPFAGLLFVALLPTIAVGADQQFVLQVPGQPALRSDARVDAQGLTIADSSGNRFRYVRRPQLDSVDGKFLGYYCAAADRYVRWPVAGSGAMYLGESRGGRVTWRQSQMQVQPMGGAGKVVVNPGAGPAAPATMSHVALLDLPNEPPVAAHIDGNGGLHMYNYRQDRWERMPANLQRGLVPGAPLVLRSSPRARFPHVYSVDARGDLLEIADGQRIHAINDPGLPRLTGAAHLLGAPDPTEYRVYAVDTLGRVWDLGLQNRVHRLVESRRGLFEPGIPLGILSAADDELFLIDRSGDLFRYAKSAGGSWGNPETIARGFQSGGYVDAVRVSVAGGVPTRYVTAVDSRGRLRLLTSRARGWLDEDVQGVVLPVGSPVGVAYDRGLSLSAIHSDGRWRQWRRSGGRWQDYLIADGFLSGAPVLFDSYGPRAFAVDRRGRLNSARYVGGRWQCALCMPGFAFAPQLVSRSVVPNPALTPANIEFVNSHSDPLVLKIADRRSPGKPKELTVAPGKSSQFRVDRDAGAVLKEVYLVPGPLGTLVEQVHQYPLPPKIYYDIVVYDNRVTSVFFDRTKNRTSKPDSVQRSRVSLGVFPLPPGELLREGDRVDAYQEAKHQDNPGAAASFGKP